ncbi:TonB-dependent siderophore receptor [Halarcobacter mediterraneus]|uniref:TonB-dependent siderophore receptor n=1 Tax=Halarcobacter mediterraneus TaxID=2023153 RepID=A0A4Q1ATL2_9BACT|nr:TonB-dependent receptor [Halarcobacter mediterraneus]RXK13113.1 TonB-dependent siderophore receptor [Halarcobacter mediterraneus]
MKQRIVKLSFSTALILFNILNANETQNVGEVTVTANKMEENIKDIPQSITVMTDVEIEEKGIDKVSDLIKYIPNLITSYMNSDRVNFRGINNSHFTNTNPIVIFIDGIPYSNMYGFDKTISNILRVEVLRGPQGSIYGRDSMGGVINIITKEPSNTVEGSISAEYSTDNTKDTAFDISTPLIDNKLFLGINGTYFQTDGYATNHHPKNKENANEQERYLFNANLKYNPTDNLSIKFIINNDKNDKYGIEGGIAPLGSDISSYKKEDFEELSYDVDTYTKAKTNSQALHVDYDFNDITFSSLTTHSISNTETNIDLDLSDDPVWDDLSTFSKQETKNLSQEFRLSGEKDTFKWIAGVYYEKNKLNNDKFGATYPASMMGNPFGAGIDVSMNAISEINSDTIATFGQVVIPFWEDYELTLGGRYQKIKKEIDLNYYVLPSGTTGNPINTFDTDNTWNTFLPKLALSYKIDNDLTSYFSITQGYLAGGYNLFPSGGGTVEQNKFDAQKSTNYELGIRGNLLDNSLYLSAALFYMDIDDMHVYSYDATATGYTSNAGKAHSQGLELELEYTINDNWSIGTSLGFIEAKYDEYTDQSGNSNKDNKIEMTPSHTANIGVSYFNDNGIYGRFDIRNQGKIYFDSANDMKEDPYTIANIKVGYLFDDWDIYTYANNMTDESYLTTATAWSTGNALTFGKGRFIGIGAKYRF